MKKVFVSAGIMAIICSALISCQSKKIEGPFFATGIKIGEVSQEEAIIWVRLTRNAERVHDSIMPVIKYIDPESGELTQLQGRKNKSPLVSYPQGYSIQNIEGACPGSMGKVRVKHRLKDEKSWMKSAWIAVDSTKDFTSQVILSDLQAGSSYEILVEAKALSSWRKSAFMEGNFKTAPSADNISEVNFIVTTGTSYPDVDSESGYKLYPSSLKLDPEFFVHTGDIVYYDDYGKTEALARWHWDRMYSYPNNIDYHRQVASYFIKDDHDTWMNDAFPGMQTKFMGEFTFEQGLKIFPEEVPMGNLTYRSFRWGKDLQIWMVEGRNYRSKNSMEDGPDKTIWGKKQMDWFTTSVEASDATFKILISPTPIVGPDRVKKNDNHANAGFSFEGNKIRQFLSQQENMYVICGDRHWQYISKDLESGLIEFSCGPGSNDHAGGWSQDNILPEHIYLNVVGGFLEAEVSSKSGKALLTIRHYDPDGNLLNEYIAK